MIRRVLGVLILLIAGAPQAVGQPIPADEPHQLQANHGAGWRTVENFRTLAECDRAARLYWDQHKVSAGCLSIVTLCADNSGVDLFRKPGQRIEILGTARQRFDFDKCMAEAGYPMETTR